MGSGWEGGKGKEGVFCVCSANERDKHRTTQRGPLESPSSAPRPKAHAAPTLCSPVQSYQRVWSREHTRGGGVSPVVRVVLVGDFSLGCV